LIGGRQGRGEPSPFSLYQLKGLNWHVEPLDLTEAARLDGVEYLARSTVQFTGFRLARAPKVQWSTWTYPTAQPFIPEVVLSKVKGQWHADTYSPFVHSPTNNAVDDLVPFDCRWLHDGALDPAKLKPLWLDAGADIEKGDLKTAEDKISTGLAWLPGDPEFLLLFANLRLAQAKIESDPEERGRLRHEAYEALLTTARNDAAHRPNRDQILANLMLIEGARKWGCSMAQHGTNPFLGPFADLLRESGACE
jgi:hypothetical protein